MAKVLIVDDSAMSRRLLRRILEAAGHDVAEAEDGMVAIEKYYLERPDIVLLDLIMKGMFGMEAESSGTGQGASFILKMPWSGARKSAGLA
jgi:CheY-like chemotaxis protein